MSKVREVIFLFYDVFVELCEKCETTPAKVRADLGISQSTMASWKSRNLKPKYETLIKLADYFNVPTNYLAGEDELCNNLRAYRKLNGLTQHELSKKTGIPLNMIKAYENRNSPSFITEDELRTIADSLGVPPLKLLGRSATLEFMIGISEGNNHTRMNEAFFKLNLLGQQKVADYAEDLTRVPEYRRMNTPQPPSEPPQSAQVPKEDTDTTPPTESAEGLQEGK